MNLKRTNLTLCEELNMADKFDHIEGGSNHSYHLGKRKLYDDKIYLYFGSLTNSSSPMPRTEVLRGRPQTVVKHGFSWHIFSDSVNFH